MASGKGLSSRFPACQRLQPVLFCTSSSTDAFCCEHPVDLIVAVRSATHQFTTSRGQRDPSLAQHFRQDLPSSVSSMQVLSGLRPFSAHHTLQSPAVNKAAQRGSPGPVVSAQRLKSATLEQLPDTSGSASIALQSRRNVAIGGLLSLASLQLLPTFPAHASILRSQRSDRPCALTVQNNGLRPIKLFWINYDGKPVCLPEMGFKPLFIIGPLHAQSNAC